MHPPPAGSVCMLSYVSNKEFPSEAFNLYFIRRSKHTEHDLEMVRWVYMRSFPFSSSRNLSDTLAFGHQLSLLEGHRT